jgi:hypothetical protein
MNRNLKVQSWLTSEMEKDKNDLKNEKEKFINEIKSLKKEEMFKKTEQKKLTFWERLKKVLF